MEVINRIQFVTVDGEAIDELFFYSPGFISPSCGLCVELLDTVTGQTRLVEGNGSKEVSELFGQDSPYGYSEARDYKTKKVSGCLLIAIDSLSLQFLECVKTVRRRIIQYWEPLAKRLCPFPEVEKSLTQFTHWDEEMSLFTCRLADKTSSCGCTLLHAVGYAQDGWSDDMFYLFHKFFLDVGLGVSAVGAYEIEFQDISKARAILGKLTYSGNNSIEAYSELLRGKI